MGIRTRCRDTRIPAGADDVRRPRGRDRQAVAAALAYRLVTVTGPGGVGKTRLAAEVARRLSDRFGDRIWLVELAAVSAPAAGVRGDRDAPGRSANNGRSAMQAAAAVLAGEPTLLVLDNCEHLVEAVAEACDELLALCDDVVVLATSREPLGVAGEARLRLRPAGGEAAGRCAGRRGGRRHAVRRPGAPGRSGLRAERRSRRLSCRTSWCAWTGCHSRSNWRPRGSSHSGWPSCTRDWPRPSGCSRRAPARLRCGTARCEPPSTGATSC